jgi:predicted nucleic acid-binding Zn finger protein
MMRAREIAGSGGVKRHVFMPSGTEIMTVVGNEGEYIVSDNPPLCTCPAFFFSLTRGNKKSCHHLLALTLAEHDGRVAITRGHDDEIPAFLSLLWGTGAATHRRQINE